MHDRDLDLFVHVVETELGEGRQGHHGRLILCRFAAAAGAVEHLRRSCVERQQCQAIAVVALREVRELYLKAGKSGLFFNKSIDW